MPPPVTSPVSSGDVLGPERSRVDTESREEGRVEKSPQSALVLRNQDEEVVEKGSFSTTAEVQKAEVDPLAKKSYASVLRNMVLKNRSL